MTVFDDKYQNIDTYGFVCRDVIRFTDLDALGHLSAVRTGEFFTNARALWLRTAINGWPAACPQLPVLKVSTIVNLREAHFPADVQTGLAVESFGRTSFRIVMGAFEGENCFALSRNVFVFIDSKTRQPVEPESGLVAALHAAASRTEK